MGNYLSGVAGSSATAVDPSLRLMDNYRQFINTISPADRETLRGIANPDNESEEYASVKKTLHVIRRLFDKYSRRNEDYSCQGNNNNNNGLGCMQKIFIESDNAEDVAIIFFVALFPDLVSDIYIAFTSDYVDSLLAMLLRFMPRPFRIYLSHQLADSYDFADMEAEKLIFSILTDSGFNENLRHMTKFGSVYEIATDPALSSGETKGLRDHTFMQHLKEWPSDSWIDFEVAFFSDYALENLLGEGSFGKVVSIDNFTDMGQVACKLYKPSIHDKTWTSMHSAVKEIANWWFLQGEKFVDPKDFERDRTSFKIAPLYALYTFTSKKGNEYIVAVMPKLDGTVRSVIHSTKNITSKWELIMGMFRAGQYLIEKNMIHCDTKPDNFLQWRDQLDKPFSVFFADFGLSEPVYLDEDEMLACKYGDGVHGTYHYCPPEVNKFNIDCHNKTSSQSSPPAIIKMNPEEREVYALAVCAWELLKEDAFIKKGLVDKTEKHYQYAYNCYKYRMADPETFRDIPHFLLRCFWAENVQRGTIQNMLDGARKYIENGYKDVPI